MRIAFVFLLLAGLLGTASAETETRVFLNGTPASVFFNDGDSFRVLTGKYSGTRARLAGFNTLESFGPTHQWGHWTARELYVIAKLGTLNGRRGIWNCTSDLNTDTYGRILWWCPDLAVDQVRKGLAHAMSITREPAKPELVAAQKEAVAAKRGMWAHGVPDFVLTSLHSVDERPGDKPAYNRLVSSVDGHSKKWKHRDAYTECDVLCYPSALGPEIVADLKAAGLTGPAAEYDEKRLLRLFAQFIKDRTVGAIDRDIGLMQPEHRAALEAAFGVMVATGPMRTCMVYTNYRRRYGQQKAPCLK
ncbi:MAG: endonuclease YncB(thermonuclease family) [Bradymonadia bacterium]